MALFLKTPVASVQGSGVVLVFYFVKRYHNHSMSYQGSILLVIAYSFRGLIHRHHGGKHDLMQAGMVPHPDPEAAGRERERHWALLKPQSPHHRHIYSSKATPPNPS